MVTLERLHHSTPDSLVACMHPASAQMPAAFCTSGDGGTYEQCTGVPTATAICLTRLAVAVQLLQFKVTA